MLFLLNIELFGIQALVFDVIWREVRLIFRLCLERLTNPLVRFKSVQSGNRETDNCVQDYP